MNTSNEDKSFLNQLNQEQDATVLTGQNISIPFLKSYQTTSPSLQETVQNYPSNNSWEYPSLLDGRPLEVAFGQFEATPKAGFWSNFSHNMGKANSLWQTGKLALDTLQNSFPTDENVPDDWDVKPEDLEGFTQEYYDYLVDARGPNDLLARQQKARQQMQEDQEFANGGIISSLLGGIAGTALDPMTYLLPLASGIKYTTLTSNVARNLLRAQPGLALGGVMTAGLEQANRIGGNLSDMAKQAAVDYVFSNALFGLGFGAGFYKDEFSRIYGSRNIMKILPEGAKVNFETAEAPGGGLQFTGKVNVSPMGGVALSAQKLDAASLYANEIMAQSGLFDTFVGQKLQKALGWGWLASPVIRASNSTYASVRGFFNRIAPISVRTAGEMKGEAVLPTASEIASFISDKGKKLGLDLNELFAKANGIVGANTLKGTGKLLKATWDNALNISREDFAQEVMKRVTKEGYVSAHAECNEAGDMVAEYFKQLGERFTKATGNDMFLDPVNAFRYLPMNYWIPAIRNNESGFVDLVSNAYKRQDETIERLSAPVNRHENRITDLKTAIKELKETNPDSREIKNLENQLRLEERNRQLEQDKLVKTLRDNKQHHVLLEDRVYFTEEEISKLKEYLKPIQKAKETLDGHIENLNFAQDRLKENIKQIASIEKSTRLGKKSEKLASIKNELEQINVQLDAKIKQIEKQKEPIKNRKEKTLEDLKTKQKRIKEKLKSATSEKQKTKYTQQLEKIKTSITDEKNAIETLKQELKDSISNYRDDAANAKKIIRKKSIELKKTTGDVQEKALNLDFLKDEQVDLKSLVELEQARVDKAQTSYDQQLYSLEDMARNGTIDKKFFKEMGNKIVFHEPKTPKFRKVHEDDNERILKAKQLMETIYNESPSDILANVFGDQEPGLIANPHYLKSRSVMIDQSELIPFLDPDLTKSINNYSSVFGKIIGLKEALPEFAQGPALEGVLLNFKLEHAAKKEELEAKILAGDFTEKQAQKMRSKFDKEFEREQKFLKDTLATYFGTYGGAKNPEIRRAITSLKNLVSSAKLGNVPLYIMQEYAGLMMKQGLMPFLSQGLGSAFRGLAKLETEEEKLARKEMASHAFIGMNSVFMGHTNRFIDSNEMSFAPVNSASENFGRITDKIAAVSNAFYGTNKIQNLEEELVANTGQSEIMSWCYKFRDGTITDVQRQKAARYGIDLPNDAENFIKNFEATPGTWKHNDGYMSLYHRWEDAASVEKFAMSLRRMVKDQVVQADKFNSPYWAQNEFLSMFFMFHGWAYGYLTKYAIPFMQRPDIDQMLGIAMMTSMGMGIEALRRFSNGKEMWDDDTQWHKEALKSLMDSGMLAGPYWQYAVELNNFLGVIPNMGTERFRDRKGIGQFSPIFGYLETVGRVGHHFTKGDITQGDMKSFVGLLPLLSGVFRKPIGDFIRNSTLPEKRSDAEPWSFMAPLYEE